MMDTIFLILEILGYACLLVFAVTGLVAWIGVFFYYFIFQLEKEERERKIKKIKIGDREVEYY